MTLSYQIVAAMLAMGFLPPEEPGDESLAHPFFGDGEVRLDDPNPEVANLVGIIIVAEGATDQSVLRARGIRWAWHTPEIVDAAHSAIVYLKGRARNAIRKGLPYSFADVNSAAAQQFLTERSAEVDMISPYELLRRYLTGDQYLYPRYQAEGTMPQLHVSFIYDEEAPTPSAN